MSRVMSGSPGGGRRGLVHRLAPSDRYNRSTGEYIDDKSLRMRVHTALSDNPDYKFEGVTVAVFKGTVPKLSGFVDLPAQRTQAGDIVKAVPGVRDVANSITVKDQSERTAGGIR